MTKIIISTTDAENNRQLILRITNNISFDK